MEITGLIKKAFSANSFVLSGTDEFRKKAIASNVKRIQDMVPATSFLGDPGYYGESGLLISISTAAQIAADLGGEDSKKFLPSKNSLQTYTASFKLYSPDPPFETIAINIKKWATELYDKGIILASGGVEPNRA